MSTTALTVDEHGLPVIEEVETKTPEAEDIELVRGIRKTIVSELTKDKVPVEDPDKLDVLLTVLKDIDHSANTRLRIKTEEKAARNQEQENNLIASVLRQIQPGKLAAPIDVEATVVRETPSLPDGLVTREYVPGEMDQGTDNTTYEEFMKRMKPEE